MQLQCNPLAFCFSLFPFLFGPLSFSLYLLGTLLAVIGSCPPRSQVAHKLISPFPSLSPYTPLSKIPAPWGFPAQNMHITKTTSQTWLARSSTTGKKRTRENYKITRKGWNKIIWTYDRLTKNRRRSPTISTFKCCEIVVIFPCKKWNDL
jgi:hypothetical protein